MIVRVSAVLPMKDETLTLPRHCVSLVDKGTLLRCWSWLSKVIESEYAERISVRVRRLGTA